VIGFGSGWYPGGGVVTPTWMPSRSCARAPPGEWHVVHDCSLKSVTAIAGTVGNGVVTLEWQVRQGIDALEVLCVAPAATLNTMAAFDGSCFPLFEVVEYETETGTLESEWHFKQRNDVSSGLAGFGQMRSGTAAWNEAPLAVVIWACVWQPVQSIFAGSLIKAV